MARRQALNARLGNPQMAFAAVHVAGTNGKGSTAAMVAAGLRAAGRRVGRFTSPDLEGPHERFWVDGHLITPEALALLASEVAVAAGEVERQFPGAPFTYFEHRCAEAWLHFAREGVELAVVEVGIGGRTDATNVLERKALTLVSAIGLDHTEKLGDTLDAIAREKAGILRPGVPALTTATGPALRALAEVAEAVGAPLTVAPRLEAAPGPDGRFTVRLEDGPCILALAGQFQVENASLAVAALKALGVGHEAIRAGLSGVEWPGRLELVADPAGGEWLLDGAHNPHAIAALVAAWGPVAVTVAAVMGTKAAPEMVRMLTAGGRPLVLPSEMEGEYWAAADLSAYGDGTFHPCGSLEEALATARRLAPGGRRCVTGSIRLVGAVRRLLSEGAR